MLEEFLTNKSKICEHTLVGVMLLLFNVNSLMIKDRKISNAPKWCINLVTAKSTFLVGQILAMASKNLKQYYTSFQLYTLDAQ